MNKILDIVMFLIVALIVLAAIRFAPNAAKLITSGGGVLTQESQILSGATPYGNFQAAA